MRLTDGEKLDLVKTLMEIDTTDISEDRLIEAYLSVAAREIIDWRYSYSTEKPDTIPEEYEMTQVFAVVAGYSQGGAEGQTSHSENGISRVFQYSDMLRYIRANVIPKCKVV